MKQIYVSAHYLAFMAKASTVDFSYFTKEEGDTPSLAEINENTLKLGKAIEAMREKNDSRLTQLETNGNVDAVTKEELKKVTDDVLEARDILKDLEKKLSRPGGDTKVNGEVVSPEAKDHQEKFLAFMRSPADEQLKMDCQKAEKAALSAIQGKAVSTITDGAGGHAVPEVVSRKIEREVDETSNLRGIVDVTPAGSKDYKELVDVRGMAYGWVGETDVRPETGTPSLEEVAPTFGMIYAYPKATEESLDDIFFNVERWLIKSAVEAFATGEENAIIVGNGVKKPTGFLNGVPTVEADGVRPFGTLQYLPMGAAADFSAAAPADPIILMIQTLKKKYRSRARFLCNKFTVGSLMTFKDGDGNYLWKMGDIKTGQPDRLMGYGITESEEMPDVAADAFPLAFGDFHAGYLFNPLVGLRMTKDEVTTPGYVKWYIRRRIGGTVKKSEAIKLAKISVG